MNSIFHRISVRKYEDRPIEKEKIMEILRAGMQAPSACNQQPCRSRGAAAFADDQVRAGQHRNYAGERGKGDGAGVSGAVPRP